VVFQDAGHILGSAMLKLTARENGQSRRVLFSGDVGQWGKPIIRDPTLFDQADYVVMESTYGDRQHPAAGDIATQLCDIINDTVRRGGNVVIPTFAVERSQELMYYISGLLHAGRIPAMPVFSTAGNQSPHFFVETVAIVLENFGHVDCHRAIQVSAGITSAAASRIWPSVTSALSACAGVDTPKSAASCVKKELTLMLLSPMAFQSATVRSTWLPGSNASKTPSRISL
jgi:hypothetical protein